jgi:hypothetical protein
VPAPAFVAAAPLVGTTRSHEYQSRLVQRVSRARTLSLGTGAQALIVSRWWGAANARSRAAMRVAAGIKLVDEHGEELVDLAARSRQESRGDPVAACNIELAPGWYAVRLSRPDRPTVEQALVACEGWQTQMFLLREGARKGRRDAGEHVRISVLMSRIRDGFDPARDDVRLTEVALLGLASQRAVVTRADLNAMLKGKFVDPMLGIYGAHVLLDRAGTPGQRTDIAVVVRNLRKLVGDHPDVVALATLAGRTKGLRVTHPPMLMASWRRIVSATATSPLLVPAGSLAERCARRLWGSGVWLWWRAHDHEEASTSAALALRASARASALDELVRRGTGAMDVPPSLSTSAAALWRMVPESGVADDECVDVVRQIVESMGMPRGLVEPLAAEILEIIEPMATPRGLVHPLAAEILQATQPAAPPPPYERSFVEEPRGFALSLRPAGTPRRSKA